uniref:EamA domain-containing protein n=1 Tax=candidate division WOR-3 bacterium TaxID=2052148 RepID=A0A7V3KPG7_UNCW3
MIYAILSVLLWSTQATAFKLTLRYTNQFGLLVLSSSTSLIVYLIWLTATNKFTDQVKNFKGNTNSLILGFLNPFLYYIVLFTAYSLLKAQEALALNYLWPIVLTILSSMLLKKPLTPVKLIALFLSFSGAFITITQGNIKNLSFKNPLGVTLALLSTVIWALYWLLNMTDKRETETKLFYNFLFGNLYLLIFTLILRPVKISSPIALLGGIYVGLFEMGITFLLWLKALSTIKDTARVSNLIYFAPFLSLLFISLVLKEKIYTSTIIGLVLIISGVLLQEYLHTKRGSKNGVNIVRN